MTLIHIIEYICRESLANAFEIILLMVTQSSDESVFAYWIILEAILWAIQYYAMLIKFLAQRNNSWSLTSDPSSIARFVI